MKPSSLNYSHLALLFTAAFSTSVTAYEVRSGGKTSVKKDGANAYSLPAANLPMSKRLDFSVGNSFLETLGYKRQRLQKREMDSDHYSIPMVVKTAISKMAEVIHLKKGISTPFLC